jgi:protoporphyrinogen oxidase
VLEGADRPGGLVRTDHVDGFWFDHVLHLLHFADDEVERRVRKMLGETLVACPTVAWVETSGGVTQYPLQMHLAPLARDQVVRCLHDLAEVTFRPKLGTPANFEDYLLRTFGRGLCELFLFPYNRKVWKRPLADLAPSGFTWTITPPDFERVLRGALDRETPFRSYNANGWYPRPAKDADCRGMEVLSRAVARQVPDLRCGHRVEAIDPVARIVTARHGDTLVRVRYREACVTTLPLPDTIRMSSQVPADLSNACATLTRNRVITVMIGVRGPRPEGLGHWRYYADESIVFTRLVFLHEFDPDTAPADGWGLLTEITEPAEQPLDTQENVVRRVLRDVERVGVLPPGSEIVVTATRVIDPAYVVFSPTSQAVTEQAHAFLAEHDIVSLGRYGRWEYSSMAQNLRDGFRWAEGVLGRRWQPADAPASGVERLSALNSAGEAR